MNNFDLPINGPPMPMLVGCIQGTMTCEPVVTSNLKVGISIIMKVSKCREVSELSLIRCESVRPKIS